ncbi:MAG: baseplate J/gp47 family protein [Oscillospiraceae bacterium]
MYEDKTPEKIRGDMLARLHTDLEKSEGGFVSELLAAAALEISTLYQSLNALTPMFYVDPTSGVYLDKLAAVLGLRRKAGTLATGSLTFTGDAGAVIPAGTPFYTRGGLAFLLDSAATLTDTGAVGALTAEQVGLAYNIGSGEIVSTLRNYSGVTGYKNGAIAGGTDPETDDALCGRIYARLRRSPTSGNPYHYQSWALTVSGVGAARVLSKWDGPGTVQVLLASGELTPVAADVVAAAKVKIEAERPVGAGVTVVSATGHPVAIAATVTIDGSTTKAAVQSQFAAAATGYLRALAAGEFDTAIDVDFETIASRSYTVLYNRMAFLLLSIPGVRDYSLLTVGGGTGNLTILATEVPILTEVTIA